MPETKPEMSSPESSKAGEPRGDTRNGSRAAAEPPGSAAAPGESHGAAESPPLVDERVLQMLDGASSPRLALTPEMDEQRVIAADRRRNLEVRLEAYQEIIDSEVGDTTLARARNLERDVNLRQIFLKFEGGNPTGTQKDRIAFGQCHDAIRRGFDGITVATCGNFGAALALAAWLGGLRCVACIPEQYHTRRVAEMEGYGAEIVRVPRDYEGTVESSREIAEREGLYDANPGGINTALQLKKYGQIAFEIYDDLRDAPFACAVPVSNGTTLAGIFKGFGSLDRRGKTSRVPRMVAGSSFRKNPIVQAFAKNLDRCEDLPPDSIRETVVNEPLINWRSSDGDEALSAIRLSNGWADDASDRELLACARMLREREGLHVLPASTAGLVALLNKHRKEPLPGDRYVCVLTGRKS
jgi:threonine synthase